MSASPTCVSRRGLAVALALLSCWGCQAQRQSRTPENAWSRDFSPPRTLDTERLHLEPLTPDHAALDHAAFMSSRAHLQRTLHWGNWPREGTTVEDNRKDLARHGQEFQNREAFAYTVLTPDRSRCLGCVYLNPVEGRPRSVDVTYWVIEPELRTNLDQHLAGAVLYWIEQKWPFDEAVLSLHADNPRGIDIARSLQLVAGTPPDEDHLLFDLAAVLIPNQQAHAPNA